MTLRTYQSLYPDMILGLSDHTRGFVTVLGAIVLGARVIEKHFTDNNEREGPDHYFSMTPSSWKEMVKRSRELELSLGDSVKKIEENEKETVILQRRCIRLKRDLSKGTMINKSDLVYLRPAPVGSLEPYQTLLVIGKMLLRSKKEGEEIYPNEIK